MSVNTAKHESVWLESCELICFVGIFLLEVVCFVSRQKVHLTWERFDFDGNLCDRLAQGPRQMV